MLLELTGGGGPVLLELPGGGLTLLEELLLEDDDELLLKELLDDDGIEEDEEGTIEEDEKPPVDELPETISAVPTNAIPPESTDIGDGPTKAISSKPPNERNISFSDVRNPKVVSSQMQANSVASSKVSMPRQAAHHR